MSADGKCVSTRVPSMPSQAKVWWGKVLVWFQEIFCVTKNRDGLCAMSCGKAPE